MIIGVTGSNASGKDTVALFLEKRGFQHLSLSDELRDELKKKKLPLTRNNLIKIGNDLRKKYGPDILAKRVFKKVSLKNVVLTSIRNTAEVNFLERRKDFALLVIDADPKLRYKRSKKRGRIGEGETFEEFLEKENREKQDHSFGQQLHLCMELADYKIENNTTRKNLYKNIENFLKKLEKSNEK